MRKIRSILLALAMVLTLLPVSAFAVGTDRTEDLAALEEQMRQELFSADDRIYAEDYEAPEAPDPDEIIRVLVETRSAPALEIASTVSHAFLLTVPLETAFPWQPAPPPAPPVFCCCQSPAPPRSR